MENCVMWSMLDENKVYKKCSQVNSLETKIKQLQADNDRLKKEPIVPALRKYKDGKEV